MLNSVKSKEKEGCLLDAGSQRLQFGPLKKKKAHSCTRCEEGPINLHAALCSLRNTWQRGDLTLGQMDRQASPPVANSPFALCSSSVIMASKQLRLGLFVYFNPAGEVSACSSIWFSSCPCSSSVFTSDTWVL
ncbi:unnamed protein product [Gadus morhua 'NCC']